MKICDDSLVVEDSASLSCFWVLNLQILKSGTLFYEIQFITFDPPRSSTENCFTTLHKIHEKLSSNWGTTVKVECEGWFPNRTFLLLLLLRTIENSNKA